MHGKNLAERGDVYAYAPRTRARMEIDEFMARLRTPEAFEPGECWLWPGAVTTNGYGNTRRHGEVIGSRAAWIEACGPIPDGRWVLHHCDNPPCGRPSHLYLGTAADNNRDTVTRGRRDDPRGEAARLAKYSDDVIREVRELAARGERQCDIARKLGIEASYVSRLVRGLYRKPEAKE